VDLGTGRSAKSVTVGDDHTCAVLDNGSVKCWGRNTHGVLGIGQGLIGGTTRGDGQGEMGDNLPVVDLGSGLSAKHISASRHHTCAVMDDDSVKCWGYNDQGQLGLGDKNDRGDDGGEMGNSLPAVDLGTGRTAKSIAAGFENACALLDDGFVKCWGYRISGRFLPNAKTGVLLRVDLGTGRSAVAISANYLHTCAVLDDSTLKCWGSNGWGQLGDGSAFFLTGDNGDNGGEMGDSLSAVDLGTGRSAKSVAAGSYHTCALLDDDSLKCFGSNYYGEQGKGDTLLTYRSGQLGDSMAAVDLGTGRSARSAVAVRSRTCVILDNGSVKCFGWNSKGQLGLGDTSNRGDGGGEMGDSLPAVDLGTVSVSGGNVFIFERGGWVAQRA